MNEDRVRPASFTPCAEDGELDCGQLVVPVDYDNVGSARFTLATVRARATGPGRRGILFVNPGGPGGSGVDFVIQAKALLGPLREQFDIVSFDPRGIARSQAVDCTIELPPPPQSGALSELAAFDDAISARYAEACRAQHGDAVLHVGSDDVARDIDSFRAALGEREVSYLGVSYGTALGTAYATLFPDRVRAMVLDGNLTPAWFSDYLLELDADGSAGAELALRRLDQLCAADAACPLARTGVVATYDRVTARLDASPVQFDDRSLSGAALRSAVMRALTDEREGWPLLVRWLASADAGDYRELADWAVAPGDGTLALPGAFAVICDDSATRRPGLDYLPAQLGDHALYPRFGGSNIGFALTACAAWPRTRIAPIRDLRTRNPVMLIGNDFDPATPMAWSRSLAAALGPQAILVRYRGGGHTVLLSGSACIDDAITAYFVEPSHPPHGLVCPAASLSFATPAVAARAARPTLAGIVQQLGPAHPSAR